jgi:outer membrane protein assembly factor BamB
VQTGIVLALLVLIATAVPATPSLGQGQSASIRLSPDIGPPTSRVEVLGEGFGGSEGVLLQFHGRRHAKAHTNPSGQFSKEIVVPASADPGPQTVVATGRTSGSQARAVFTVQTDWPSFHFDHMNTGFNPFENVLSASNVDRLSQAWVTPMPGFVVSTPVVVDESVYVGTGTADGSARSSVLALDREMGSVVWQRDLFSGATSTLTVADGTVFVRSFADSAMYALDSATGATIWSFPTFGVSTPPAVADGVVYVASFEHIYAIDAGSGDPVWTTEISRCLLLRGPGGVGWHRVRRFPPHEAYVRVGCHQWNCSLVP